MRFGILGNGYLAGVIADAWRAGLLPGYELAAVCGRTAEKTAALAARAGCRGCASVEEMLELGLDYVAEAASVEAVREHAIAILSRNCGMVVLSAGAFADGDFYCQVGKAAAEHGVKVHIASGAIGGFDILRTISLMGSASASILARKGPEGFAGTPLYDGSPAEAAQPKQLFSGNAEEAIALLPTKVNVAVAAALATVGPEQTQVTICSVPGMAGASHRISVEAGGAEAVLEICSETDALAGWSVVAALRNIASPIVF